MRKFTILFIICLISSYSKAASITWTNANGTGIWNDAGNWSAGIPGSADLAIFDATSTDDCLIDINIDVRGIALRTGYTGTVTQGSGNTIIVRNQDVFMAEGTFLGGDSQIDMIDGNFTIRGGSFTSTSDTLFLDVNFVVSDSGAFQHNNGTVVFDDGGNRVINVINKDTLFNMVLSPTANNARLDINGADTIIVLNKLQLNEGRLRGGPIEVGDSVELNGSYDDGNNQIWFNGNGNGVLLVNARVGSHPYFIAKENTTDTVFVRNSNSSIIEWGDISDILTIVSGNISLTQESDLDFNEIEIRSGASFTASSFETRFLGSWDNQGGLFNPNGGSWRWNLEANRNYRSTVVDTFYNFIYEPTGDFTLGLLADDSAYVINKLELINGRVQRGHLLVEDTTILNTTYDEGTAGLWFIGNKTSNFIIEAAQGNFDLFIRKTNATDTVYFEALSGNSINIGETVRDLTVREGIISFSKVNSADIDYSDIFLENGTEFIASPGTTNYQGNWSNQNSQFHANNGSWIFDPIADNRTFLTTQVDSFFNLEIAGSNNIRINMHADDSLYISNKLELTNGRIQTGNLIVEDTAILYSTYDDGSADIWFKGATTSNFLIEAALGNFDVFITKDSPTDTVFFQPLSGSILNIGETDRDLTIQEGVLSFNIATTVDLDFGDLIILNGAVLEATSGVTNYQGSWVNLGGKFNSNQGTWIWDNVGNRGYATSEVDTFYTLLYEPTVNNVALVLASDDSIYIENRLDLAEGRILTGNLLVNDTAYLYSNYDDGSADIYFIGSTTSDFFIESAVGDIDFFIRKDNATDTVFFQPFSGDTLFIGETDRDLIIEEGVLSLGLVNNSDLDFSDIIIQTGSQLQASPNTTFYQGNWNNQGGLFKANMGNWIWDNNNNRTYLSTQVDTFFNFNYNPVVNNAALSTLSDDSIYVINKLELSEGKIQTGHLLVEDTVYLFANYDDATADLYFKGSVTSNFIIEAAQGNFDKFITKNTSTDTVFYQPLSGNNLTIGETDRDLTIQVGILSFDLVSDTLNLEYENVNILSNGQLQTTSGITFFQGNWNNQGGVFKANQGDWIWGNSVNRTYVSTVVDTFFNFNYIPTINRVLTMAADDSIYIQNKLELSNGRINTGHFLVLDTAYLYTTYDDGSADIWFVGDVSSNFIIESAEGNFDKFIRKDSPTDTVFFQPLTGSSLNIGETDRDLTIQEGILSFGLVSDTANLDYSDIVIEAGAKLQASPGLTEFQGSWNNIAGKFDNNNGTWLYNLGGDRTFTSHQVDTFFRMIFDPPSGNSDLTITTGDAFAVEQALFLDRSGILNGSVLVLDTLEINSNYDNNGSADIFFAGVGDGTFISNSPNGNHDIFINKTNSTNKVDFVNENGGTLEVGNTISDLFVLEGRVEFPSNNPIELDFANLNLFDGGTFQPPADTIYFGGNWDNNLGKYEANGETFIYNSGGNRAFITTEVDTFFNFTYNTSGNRILSMGSVDTIRVLNNLELINGRIRTGVLSVLGDVTVSGTYDGDNAQADLQFVGPNAQTFDLTGGSAVFDGDILFDKSIAEEVTLNSLLDIDRAGQSITFNKGYLVTTQTNILFVDGAHDMLGTNDSSFVKGPVTKRGNQTFTFPIGDTIYAPMTISSITNGSAQFRGQYFKNDPTDDTYDVSSLEAGLNNVSTNEYWLLDRLATTASCRVNLSWRPTSGVAVPSELTVARWNIGSSQWEDEGASFTTGDANNGTITSPSINTFSPFTLASTTVNNPLPVTYKYFEAVQRPNSNLLEWVTLSEINADYFDIQKSTDGVTWEVIGRISANGNSVEEIKYQYTDFEIESPIVYYRLDQVDFDGTSNYSEVRKVDRVSKQSAELNVYPNPVINGIITMSLKDFSQSSANISIYSLQGEMVFNKLANLNQLARFNIDVSFLSKGTYIIRIDNSSDLITKKLIIL